MIVIQRRHSLLISIKTKIVSRNKALHALEVGLTMKIKHFSISMEWALSVGKIRLECNNSKLKREVNKMEEEEKNESHLHELEK